jgi:hypothetical protein
MGLKREVRDQLRVSMLVEFKVFLILSIIVALISTCGFLLVLEVECIKLMIMIRVVIV